MRKNIWIATVALSVGAIAPLSAYSDQGTPAATGTPPAASAPATPATPAAAGADTMSFHSKWFGDTDFKPMLQVGGIATKGTDSIDTMGSTIQFTGQIIAWYQRYVGIYFLGATSIAKTTATSYGGGLKVAPLSADLGADSFVNTVTLYLAGDVMHLNYNATGINDAAFDGTPTVIRYGLGTNLGIGPWGTYLDIGLMLYSSNSQFYFAPTGSIGFAF